ncbi:MAG: hypothetical protein E6J90_45135 [Deltaproteobacteria bacterium]|nr:MAG: hypothetical protein E6J90_45135 [Deltaproteobacteria bacterium]
MPPVSRSLASASVFVLGALGVVPAGAGCQSQPGAATAPPPPPAPSAGPAAPAPDEPVPLGRLPAGVRPTRESLALDIDPALDRFGGTADIALHVDRPRARLWLHGRGLAVRSAAIVLASGKQVAARWDEVDPSGVVRVTAASEIVGDVTLHVAFDAAYDEQLVGVYRVIGRSGPAVFSKFEAIYARRAFPCFDEPAFKVPYDVALTVPEADEVIGNMPVVETAAAGEGRKRVRFAATPPLPSYLVAFAVGPFETRTTTLPPSAVRSAPLPITAVALRGRGRDTAYALAEERALLVEQERYFGIGFPFPKLDLIAVPDFQSGAMENAGAITFRDSRLLIDDRVSSLGDRVAVTSVIAHETAHQWFGDYVTMPWWDDLWLNEGFATFLDTRTLRAVRPELEAELEAANRTDQVMSVDGLATARRIRQPIETTHDITNAFDGITYEKGAAVLTMLEHWIGDEPFRRGLHDFLAGHASGNATTDDLVRALTAASRTELGPVVASFLDQPGVPVVTAASRCEGGRGRIELAQAPWRAVGAVAPAASRWTIPVCVRYGAAGRTAQLCTVLDAGSCPTPTRPATTARRWPPMTSRGWPPGPVRCPPSSGSGSATTSRLRSRAPRFPAAPCCARSSRWPATRTARSRWCRASCSRWSMRSSSTAAAASAAPRCARGSPGCTRRRSLRSAGRRRPASGHGGGGSAASSTASSRSRSRTRRCSPRPRGAAAACSASIPRGPRAAPATPSPTRSRPTSPTSRSAPRRAGAGPTCSTRCSPSWRAPTTPSSGSARSSRSPRPAIRR